MQAPVAENSTRDRVWTLPNLLSMLRLAGVPLFLWLVLGPEADGWALGACWCVSGVTDFLDGWLARRLNQTSVLGQILDPVADRLYILAVVVGLALRDIIPWWLAVSLPLRDALHVGPGPAAAHPRLQLAAGALPGQGGHLQPAVRLPAAAARRRGRARVATLAQVFGWAFAFWGIGLYWWAGVLYAWQVRKLLATTPRRQLGGRRVPEAPPLPDRVTMPLLTLITQQSSTRTTSTSPSARRRRAAAGPARGGRSHRGRRRGARSSACWWPPPPCRPRARPT